MSAVLTSPRVSPEELLALEDSVAYELVDGRLVERAMGAYSSWVGTKVAHLISSHVEAEGLGGCVMDGEASYQCYEWAPLQVRRPDVSYVATGRLEGDVPPDGHVQIAPDLAVEVLSPNDNGNEVQEKVVEYLRAGVRLIWVIYPRTRSAQVFRTGGSGKQLTEEDLLCGEEVLPGFEVMVSELFKAPVARG
jgi:Uma2 family endonuclease